MFALDIKRPHSRAVYLYPNADALAEVVGRDMGATICEVPDNLCSNLEQPWRGIPTVSSPVLEYIDNLPDERKIAI